MSLMARKKNIAEKDCLFQKEKDLSSFTKEEKCEIEIKDYIKKEEVKVRLK